MNNAKYAVRYADATTGHLTFAWFTARGDAEAFRTLVSVDSMNYEVVELED